MGNSLKLILGVIIIVTLASIWQICVIKWKQEFEWFNDEFVEVKYKLVVVTIVVVIIWLILDKKNIYNVVLSKF